MDKPASISKETSLYTLEEEKRENISVSDKQLVKMLWRFLKPYWWQLLCVIALLFGVAGLQLFLPYLVKMAVDGPIANADLSGLVPLGVGYSFTIAGVFVLQIIYTFWLQTIGQSALMKLRQDLFEHIIKQDSRYFSATPVGRIVARMSND